MYHSYTGICCEFEHYNLIVIKVIRVDLRYVQLGRYLTVFCSIYIDPL